MSNDPRILIDKMLKQADMPAMPGSVNIKNRTLDFHVFDRNKLKQKLSKLPDVVKQSIQRQITEFDRAFKKFPAAQSQDYAGMLRIAYAEDRLIGEKELHDLTREQPDLVQTANFVREYGIQLPSDSAGFSAGAKVEKGIGSTFWFSIFGYAYQELARKGLEYHVAQKKNSIPRSLRENPSGRERPNSVNGTFQVVPAGEGFTFGIVNENGTTLVFDPALTKNTTIMRKFFNEPIIMNKSAVYVFPEGHPDAGSIRYVNNADAMIAASPEEANNIWGIFFDSNTGAFFLQKKGRYGAGGRPVIDKETGKPVQRTVGDKKMLTAEQVTSLANKKTIGQIYSVTAEAEGEVLDKADVASGYKYAYSIDDENTIQKIMNPKTREEFAYSVPALKQLKQWIDAKSNRYSFDDNGNASPGSSGSHTALEGFVVYMAGPDFTTGYSPEQGKTIGKADLAQYKDVPEEGVQPYGGGSMLVNRMSFVVVAKQISIPRMMASERYYEDRFGQKKIVLSPWREIRTGLPSLASAVSEMKQIITGQGGKIVEDDEGNVIERKEPLQRLNPESRGVEKADAAFRQFTGNNEPNRQIRPPVEEDPEVNPDVQASTIANRLIRSFKNNV